MTLRLTEVKAAVAEKRTAPDKNKQMGEFLGRSLVISLCSTRLHVDKYSGRKGGRGEWRRDGYHTPTIRGDKAVGI